MVRLSVTKLTYRNKLSTFSFSIISSAFAVTSSPIWSWPATATTIATFVGVWLPRPGPASTLTTSFSWHAPLPHDDRWPTTSLAIYTDRTWTSITTAAISEAGATQSSITTTKLSWSSIEATFFWATEASSGGLSFTSFLFTFAVRFYFRRSSATAQPVSLFTLSAAAAIRSSFSSFNEPTRGQGSKPEHDLPCFVRSFNTGYTSSAVRS